MTVPESTCCGASGRSHVAIVVAVVLSTALAGCSFGAFSPTERTSAATTNDTEVASETPSASAFPPETATTDGPMTVGGGDVYATPVAAPPANATVVAFNESTAAESDVLRRILQVAVAEDGTVESFDRERAVDVRDALDALPQYDGDDGEFGYYVQYRGTVLRIRLLLHT